MSDVYNKSSTAQSHCGNHSTSFTIYQTAKSAIKRKADIKLVRYNFLKNVDLM